MKKIYINGKFFCQRVTGTQRYARELLTAIDNILSENNEAAVAIEVLVPRCALSLPNFRTICTRTVGRLSGTAWEQIELPQYCKGEVLFTLSGCGPALHTRNVITIHDAAVYAAPNAYSTPYRIWHQVLGRKVAQRAEHIFTVSNFSKSEIIKWYDAGPKIISVTYLGSDHMSQIRADSSALTRFGIEGRYVLAASSDNPNKNLSRVLQAMRQPQMSDLQLVVAGGQDDRVFRSNGQRPDGVRSLGHVSDAELKTLYQNASCFVFASLYEGFGLPPLEAMSCGCPVVVSRAASLPEIFDGAAFFCDPYRIEDIGAAIRLAAESPHTVANELKSFANKFSWERCAQETLEVMNLFWTNGRL